MAGTRSTAARRRPDGGGFGTISIRRRSGRRRSRAVRPGQDESARPPPLCSCRQRRDVDRLSNGGQTLTGNGIGQFINAAPATTSSTAASARRDAAGSATTLFVDHFNDGVIDSGGVDLGAQRVHLCLARSRESHLTGATAINGTGNGSANVLTQLGRQPARRRRRRRRDGRRARQRRLIVDNIGDR